MLLSALLLLHLPEELCYLMPVNCAGSPYGNEYAGHGLNDIGDRGRVNICKGGIAEQEKETGEEIHEFENSQSFFYSHNNRILSAWYGIVSSDYFLKLRKCP